MDLAQLLGGQRRPEIRVARLDQLQDLGLYVIQTLAGGGGHDIREPSRPARFFGMVTDRFGVSLLRLALARPQRVRRPTARRALNFGLAGYARASSGH